MKTVLDYIKPLRSIFDVNSDGILVSNRNGKIIYCNPFLLGKLNLNLTELKGKNCSILFPEIDCIDIDKKLNKKQSLSIRIRHRGNHSQIQPEYYTTAYHLGSSEDPVGILFVFQGMIKTPDSEKFSPEKHSILKVMDNRADTGWIVSDVQTGKNHFVTHGMELLSGWTKEEYLHGGWGFGLANIHEDDAGRIVSDFQINLEKRNNQPFVHDHISWETIFRYKRKNKGYIRIRSVTSVLERDSNQQVKFLISSFTLATKQTGGKNATTHFEDIQNDSIKIIDGKPYINLEFLQSLRQNKNSQKSADELPDLSERELEVLILMSEGLSSEKIAQKLHVSAHTIRTHRKMLLKKLNAKNAAELIRKAEKMGLF
ncbi:MAG TPA: LuxR C-terminal-related transcriptional regulator [Bacteroidia bacterium]|nr:LuxR C-terminal-related transcriptional regulator [Bacteroidia bacterium]